MICKITTTVQEGFRPAKTQVTAKSIALKQTTQGANRETYSSLAGTMHDSGETLKLWPSNLLISPVSKVC